MLPTIAASASAARSLGYRGLADLIEIEQLSPSGIATIFDHSASKTAARDCAIIVLAAAIGRYRADPKGWDGGTIERKPGCLTTEFGDSGGRVGQVRKSSIAARSGTSERFV